MQSNNKMDSGEERLKALGYKQELRRDFTLVSNTAISFSIISTLLGVTGACLSHHEDQCARWKFIWSGNAVSHEKELRLPFIRSC